MCIGTFDLEFTLYRYGHNLKNLLLLYGQLA